MSLYQIKKPSLKDKLLAQETEEKKKLAEAEEAEKAAETAEAEEAGSKKPLKRLKNE